MSTGTEVDFEAVKQVQQKTWSAGDFAVVAKTIVIVGENLCEAVDVTPGERVLDVACGSGNTTIAAARRAWGGTVGMDFVPELLEQCGRQGFAFDMMQTSFFVSRETLIPTVSPGMALWREKLFVSMSKNATKATEFFQVPTNRVVELGTRVEL